MRALIIHTACAALLAGGCASKSSVSLVVVSVDADGPLADVATLHARVTVADQTREFDVHPTTGATLSIPPAQNFGIDIPRSMSGTLTVHVEARDSNGVVTASGDGSGAIRVGSRADVGVSLAVVDNSGDLGGMPGDMAIAPGSDMAKPTGDMVVIPPAMLTIDKTSQSFGDITVGKMSTTASFLVINAGGMASSVATLTTGGADIAEFAVDTDCGPSLPPGGRCHVTASVSPTSPGTKSATFTLSAAQGGSVGGALSANALTPGAVKITQPSGDCGSALLGVQSTKTASFTVQNTGASATTALSVMMSDPQFVATGCSGTTLAAGAMCTVTVKFTPTASGTQNASLTVSAATGGTDTASVVGVGLKPAALSVSPPSYTFASVARGVTSSETATFTVSNSGDVQSETMSTATLSGANPTSFGISSDGCKGAPVGPAPATCTIVVQFKPQVSGGNNATLNVAAGSTTVGTPSLSGVGLNPAALALSPAMPTFTKGQTLTFTVTNNGDVTSGMLGTPVLGGTNASSFTIASNGCNGKSVGPSPANCTIDVKFAAKSTGTQSATLSIAATPGGTATSTLTGPGLAPASLRLTPDHYAFATTPRLSTTGPKQTFTVTNDGDVPSATMGLATITASGQNVGAFSINPADDTCQGTQVGPAPASCTIAVQFTPQFTGVNSATLNINTSAGTALTAPLTGTGAPIWVQEATDLTLQNLNAVWAADASNIYAVGDGGTIVYRGSTGKWSTRTLSASPVPSLQSVYGNSSTDVLVAGGGIFLSFDNTTWSQWQAGSFTGLIIFGPQTWSSFYTTTSSGVYWTPPAGGWAQVKDSSSNPIPGLGKVWGTSSTDVYMYGQTLQCGFGVCSSDAEIIHTDSNGNWTRQYLVSAPNPTADVVALFGFGTPANDLYAATTVGTTLLHSTGNGTWSDMSGAPQKNWGAIWGVDAAHLWFGAYGGIYGFDGTTWTGPMVTTANIRGLFGTGVNDVYAVGDDGSHGAIYHYY